MTTIPVTDIKGNDENIMRMLLWQWKWKYKTPCFYEFDI